MHGRKKSDAPPSAEQALALKKKVDTYRQLGKLALKQVRYGAYCVPHDAYNSLT